MGTTVSNFTLISRRSELENATEQAIERALQAVGIEAQRNVSMKAPVDTGRLAASITYATRRRQGEVDRTYYNQEKARQRNNLLKSDDYRKKAEPEEHTVVIGTNVEYAKTREYASDKDAHFIRRGLQNHTNSYKRIFADILKELE